MALLTRHTIAAMACVALLQGCAQQARQPDAPEASAAETTAADVPELTLNLPQPRDCQCVVEEARDYTFLERGFAALARNDHIEAVKYFQRYQRLESSPSADWEAGVAIAYVSMLPRSPFFDPAAARASYQKLNETLTSDMQVHENTLLMRDSLESFVAMERHIADLESNNAILKEDLAKREEALRRLRELTLGQKAGRP